MATKKDSVIWNKPHYHCFGCGNLFNRSRALVHYSLHTAQTPSQQALHTTNTTPEMQTHTNTTQIHPQHTTQHTTTSSQSTVHSQQTAPAHTEPYFEAESPLEMIMHNVGPSALDFSRPATDCVPCPHCSREFHPHSLKVSFYISYPQNISYSVFKFMKTMRKLKLYQLSLYNP